MKGGWVIRINHKAEQLSFPLPARSQRAPAPPGEVRGQAAMRKSSQAGAPGFPMSPGPAGLERIKKGSKGHAGSKRTKKDQKDQKGSKKGSSLN